MQSNKSSLSSLVLLMLMLEANKKVKHRRSTDYEGGKVEEITRNGKQLEFEGGLWQAVQ